MSIESTAAEIRERRVVLTLLFLVSVFSYIDRTILSILQVPIKAALGLSDAQLGALTGLSFALFYATLAIPIARLADRTVRKNLVAGSLAVWSGMTALTGLATSYASLVFFRIGVAVGEAGSIPASHSIIADVYPPSKRSAAFALWGISLPVGLMLGYSLAGMLERLYGWRMTFAIIGIAGLLLAPVVLFAMREPKRGRYDPLPVVDAKQPSTMEAVRQLWRLRTIRYLFAAGAMHTFAWCAVNSWNAPFYVRVHGMSLQEVSLYLAVLNGVGSAVGMYMGGRLSDHFGKNNPRGRLHVVTVSMFVMVPFAIAQYMVSSSMLSMALGAVTLTLMLVYYGPILAVSQFLVPPNIRAFTTAVLLLVVNLFGLGLGPLLTGVVSDYLVNNHGMVTDSLRYAISLAALFSLAAGWLFWRASQYLPQEILVQSDTPVVHADATPAHGAMRQQH